ncbi:MULTISPECIES: pyridoxamine 5'-phosphate oxidase family protein [Microbacterium]|jgi:nitroimidazol reductase NimA-like FMN-containing flavoprotein (pyridoxamine 5'-phosphate oxidase superfamily)|uniref:pyridoxamine 5'-phosphate oxidase family protein n=1 Tax=Microbacterium TaxID=33882 RepID=UPI0019871BDA|nr:MULTISPECIES: pyridoxamine 5'-phosphate oxidase family protein [Microbacterium]MBD3758102.1 pyridoxamine 5'-phosphate oxidase family protein [Microbacterium sp.]MBZ6372006.1 pyridoxamine 5'-phosphate oxidase family protein [Microbacterium hominis]MCG7413690.1 pyridoxamine 5'-phosphate oxidase family protein [Microbacterium aurum]
MENSDAVTVLTDRQCWDRLAEQQLGRLVTHVGDVLDVFPVNYTVDRDSIVFRTAEGSKLTELTINDQVLFEVDEYTDTDAWSVIVRGTAHRLDSAEEVRAADRLPLRPWTPTLKYNYVRIIAASVSGRDIRRGEEPDRYGVQEY